MDQSIRFRLDNGSGEVKIQMTPTPFQLDGLEAECAYVLVELLKSNLNFRLQALKPLTCGEHQEIWMPEDISVWVWNTDLKLELNLSVNLQRGAAEQLHPIMLAALYRAVGGMMIMLAEQSAQDRLLPDEYLETLLQFMEEAPAMQEDLAAAIPQTV